MRTEKMTKNLINEMAVQYVMDSLSVKNEFDFGEIEFLTQKNPHLAPIKIKKEELKNTLKCQKAMLNYMLKMYRNSIGTEKEEHMRKLYNDSLIDYNDFIKQHRDELFD